jgi:hypothetical protein
MLPLLLIKWDRGNHEIFQIRHFGIRRVYVNENMAFGSLTVPTNTFSRALLLSKIAYLGGVIFNALPASLFN